MPFLFPVTRSINLPTQIGGRDDAPIFHQFDKFSKADLTGRAEFLRSDEEVRYVKDLMISRCFTSRSSLLHLRVFLPRVIPVTTRVRERLWSDSWSEDDLRDATVASLERFLPRCRK
jgi:hypothetical protein